MIAARPRVIYRVAAAATGAAAPSLVVLLVLFASNRLSAGAALISCAVVWAATALIVGRFVNDLTIIRDAVDGLDPADGTPPAGLATRGLASTARELWLAIVRLRRLWHERVRVADERLAAAEAVIAAVPDPLILLDERRRIVHANAQAAGFVGLAPEPRDLATAFRNPTVLAAADAVLRGDRARVIDFSLTVPVERQLRARFARIDHPSPDGAAAVLTLHDITELKRADQMRADFIANASHELRTPLATLLGFIETLQGPARDDAEARERFLAIMHGQASRMTRLVEDLMSLSRIELNEHVLPKDRVALSPLLRQIAEALELRAGERSMQIQLSVPPDLPDVLGDRDELAQVFQNLIDNAIKYGRAGSKITIRAQSGSPSPREGSGAENTMVSVAVRDRGEGIPREHLPRLTERFYRVDTARSREMGGTGLGLAIVKHILNHHRGLLEVESTPGVGSVFTVSLRVYSDRSAAAVSPILR